MRLALRVAIVFLLSAISSPGIPSTAAAGGDSPQAVLVLNSYHHGYEWSDREIEGVFESFEQAGSQIPLIIEHLDLKRFPGEKNQDQLGVALVEKYRNRKIGLAIVLDNPALEIALKEREKLLPGVPVVFAGINNFMPRMIEGRPGITGVAEVQDTQGILSLALALHPDTRMVLAVHDYTASGLAVRKEMEALLPAFQHRVQVVFNEPATYEEMAAQIAALPPRALVLILSFATDAKGKFLAPQISIETLIAQVQVPVYAMNETRLGHGIVGGILTRGKEMGRRAGQMALRVLEGEEPAAIPVDTSSSSLPMFDFRQLERFRIPVESLPSESIILHRPVSFYEQNKTLAWVSISVLIVLLTLIGTLMVALAREDRAELALRESEARFRLLYENAPLPYQSLDVNGNYVEVNQAFQDTLGYAREEVIGRNFGDFLHPDWGEHFKQNFPRFKAVGEILGVEFEMVKKDGSAILVLFNGRIARDNQGRFRQTHCIFTDITQRRQAEQELQAQRDMLATIFESAPYIMMLVNREMRVERINRAGAAFAGRQRQALCGLLCGEVLSCTNSVGGLGCGRNAACSGCPLRTQVLRTLATGQAILEAEGQLGVGRDKQRAARHVLISTARVRIGEEDLVLASISDISERKQAEQEKAKLEGQLQQAQKMEAIGTLAGGIAHDFNNILSVIVGNAEVLEFANAIDDSSRESLNQILAASERAKQLVRQILAFSRHGKQEKILIDPKPIVKETLEFLRASLPASIQLQHYLEPASGKIMADPTQIQQILMNLCTNAGHAMEKDEGCLQIKLSNTVLTEEDARLDPEVEPGDYVKITVADTGHGMEPSVLQRIFEPYFTTKEPGKGTGLGLSVVHGIVKSHGGMIKVSSAVGKGTTFTVFLPRAMSFEKVEDKPMPLLCMGTEKILFVDDEKAVADLGRQMFGELGYQVETRTSPIEALEVFRANPQKFDLVIADMTMPQMSGLKLARKIMEIRPGMPIILCTGFSEQANEQAASAMGIRAFLYKPLVMRDIAGAVRKALDECNATNS